MIRLRLCVHVFVHVYTLSPVLSWITPSLHVFIRFRRFVSFSCFSYFFLSFPTSYNSQSVFIRFSPCLHVLGRLIMFQTVSTCFIRFPQFSYRFVWFIHYRTVSNVSYLFLLAYTFSSRLVHFLSVFARLRLFSYVFTRFCF